MKKSKDEKVQGLLEKIEKSDLEKFEILQALQKTVFKTHPKVLERVMYGGIMFSVNKKDFGGIFAYKNHISFEFSNGAFMLNKNNILEGKGEFRSPVSCSVN